MLPFGYGQGTGQALNYGKIFENTNGFDGGANFGLAVAAMGFLSACIGGVIFLNYLRHKGKIVAGKGIVETNSITDFREENEVPLSESMDKFTIQVALVVLSYALTYLLIFGITRLLAEGSNLIETLFGFNFLFGVIVASGVKAIMNLLKRKNVITQQYENKYLMNRMGGFFFDIMVIAGIAAIDLFELQQYWVVLLIIGVLGAVATFVYNLVIAKTLFKGYENEQFLVMYGMLTGTASTGVILLREADPRFSTPAADNLVYQQLIAIAFGFPMMILATMAPENPFMTWAIVLGYLLVLNVILFRKFIFRRKKEQENV